MIFGCRFFQIRAPRISVRLLHVCPDIEMPLSFNEWTPIAEVVRDAIPVQAKEDCDMKKQRERANIERMRAETQRQLVRNQEAIIELYARLCPNRELDEVAQRTFRENLLRISVSGMEKEKDP